MNKTSVLYGIKDSKLKCAIIYWKNGSEKTLLFAGKTESEILDNIKYTSKEFPEITQDTNHRRGCRYSESKSKATSCKVMPESTMQKIKWELIRLCNKKMAA